MSTIPYFDLAIVIGGALLILGVAEIVMRLTLQLARHYGLSGSFVGLTILSIGTSLLEITTHVVGSFQILLEPAATRALSGLLLGSNVGSDIFQQNIVLPLIGLLGAVTIARQHLAQEVGALIAASLLLWLACLDGNMGRLEGALLVIAYIAYITHLSRRNRHQAHAAPIALALLAPPRVALIAILIFLGFAAMAAMADPVLGASQRLVAALSMSASLFGVLVLGVCAALPELATALIALRQRRNDIATGILIGSNVTNPLFSAGVGALISGYTVPDVIVHYDLPVKIVTGMLLCVFLWHTRTLSRIQAVALVISYLAYAVLRERWFPVDF